MKFKMKLLEDESKQMRNLANLKDALETYCNQSFQHFLSPKTQEELKMLVDEDDAKTVPKQQTDSYKVQSWLGPYWDAKIVYIIGGPPLAS